MSAKTEPARAAPGKHEHTAPFICVHLCPICGYFSSSPKTPPCPQMSQSVTPNPRPGVQKSPNLTVNVRTCPKLSTPSQFCKTNPPCPPRPPQTPQTARPVYFRQFPISVSASMPSSAPVLEPVQPAPAVAHRVGRLRALLVLAILAAASLYLIGNARVSFWERDEPWYAQCTRQMVQTGDWVVPRFLDKLRAEKPPLVYWLQATAVTLLGDREFSYRLEASVAAICTLVLLATVLWRSVGPTRAVWTVFIYSTCALIIASAKMCLTDSVLLLFVTTAQLCLFAIYRRTLHPAESTWLDERFIAAGPSRRDFPSWSVPLILWIAIGLGGLTKGPVVLAIHLTTLLALAMLDVANQGPGAWKSWLAWRRAVSWWTKVRPLLGLLTILAINAPWLLMVYRREPEFLRALVHRAREHTTTAVDGHKGWPGYHLVMIWATFFPWCLLLPAAIVSGWKRRRHITHRFALAAVIGPWIFVELWRTKLPHYVLPTFAALAFLCADVLVRCIRREQDDLLKKDFVIGSAVWAMVVVAIAFVPWLAAPRVTPLPWAAMVTFTAAGLAYAAVVFVNLLRRDLAYGAAAIGAGMIVCIGILFGWLIPQSPYLRVSERVAGIVVEHGATHPGDAIMVDYAEPGLAYYQGGTIREQPPDYFTKHGPDEWPQWIVLTNDTWNKQMPPEYHSLLQKVGQVHGLSYADRGRIEDVMIVRYRAYNPPATQPYNKPQGSL